MSIKDKGESVGEWQKKIKTSKIFILRGLIANFMPISRKDRDSNPGNSCPFTAFRVRPDRPLRHLSLLLRRKGSMFSLKSCCFYELFCIYLAKTLKKV